VGVVGSCGSCAAGVRQGTGVFRKTRSAVILWTVRRVRVYVNTVAGLSLIWRSCCSDIDKSGMIF
jgi:hypothetical protein